MPSADHAPCPLIDDHAGLVRLVEALRGASRIGLDLEGDGMFRYRARLCTMQLRIADRIVAVDTLAAWEPALLAPVLGPSGPLKVIHDAGFDARLLRDHGVDLGAVFDTALAARLLGEPATGLSALVARYCGRTLDKGPQQADWGHRPLPPEALRYLHDDVAYLFELHDVLSAQLAETGIEAEYQAELDYLLGQALRPPADPGPPFRRIKGFADLPPAGQAVLRELALWREAQAQAADVPPYRIAHDRVLLAIAERPPRDAAALQRVRGMRNGPAARMQPAVLAAVQAGLRAGVVPAAESDATLAKPPPPPAVRALRKARHAALTKWRRAAAQARGVDPQVVLPGHCLQDLVALPPELPPDLGAIAGLGAVRIERDGPALRELLRQAAAGGSD